MGSFVEVGKTGGLAEGAMKKVTAAGQEILLARVNGNYYAVDNLCPHLRGDLSAGTLEGRVITCPLQGSQFDLGDGRPVRWLKEPVSEGSACNSLRPPRPLRTYRTRVEGDSVMVEI